jgi:hypothetical protein
MTKNLADLESELDAAELRRCKLRKGLARLNVILGLSSGGEERQRLYDQLRIAEDRCKRLKAEISATKTDAQRWAELRRIQGTRGMSARRPTRSALTVRRTVSNYMTKDLIPGRD